MARRAFDALLADQDVDEIQINGLNPVYVRRRGHLQQVDIAFASEVELLDLLAALLAPLGGLPPSPLIDERLAGGLTVTAALRPVAPEGPVITIRRLFRKPPTMQELVRAGMLSPEAAEFLAGCVRGRITIVISGGMRAGAEKLLNVLGGFIPPDERVIVIEHQPDLQFAHPQRVSLLARPSGAGEISAADLIRHSQYLIADRIILGEARAGETWDWLQMLRGGCAGSMASLYAFSARGAIDRLEAMSQMHGGGLPLMVIRRQIAETVPLIVHLDRMPDGRQYVQAITEVQGMSGDVIILADLFRFEKTGMEAGQILGGLRPTGLRPMLMVTLEDAGITIPPSVFGLRTRGNV